MNENAVKISKQSGRGIALDMDGVVIDGMKYHVIAWKKTFKHFFDITVSDLDLYLVEGVKGERIVQYITEKNSIKLSNLKIKEIHAFKRDYFNEIFKIESIPGIDDLIKAILNCGYPMALVTGTSKIVADSVLLTLNIREYFTVIISGDEVTYGKPFPEPYLLAAKKMDIPQKNCLVIENAPAGISSAKSAGMKCIAVETSLNANYLEEADRIFLDLFEVIDFLVEENKITGGMRGWKI
jgi:beta-phosphoglucomutase